MSDNALSDEVALTPAVPVAPAATMMRLPDDRRPLYPLLASFSQTCFAGTLLTDLAYWKTAEMMWADFSAWLLAAGLILGVIAAVAGLVEILGHAVFRGSRAAWLHLIGNGLVLALAFLNALVHSRDAWTSVVPLGLGLSAITVILLVLTGWVGAMLYRHGVGGYDG